MTLGQGREAHHGGDDSSTLRFFAVAGMLAGEVSRRPRAVGHRQRRNQAGQGVQSFRYAAGLNHTPAYSGFLPVFIVKAVLNMPAAR